MTPDNDLRAEVRTEVARQRGSRADEVDVQVLQSVVTLTGRLPSDHDKWKLSDAIRMMPGVTDVVDETMTVPDPALRSSDPDVARPWFPAE